jgi:hypothetical protein
MIGCRFSLSFPYHGRIAEKPKRMEYPKLQGDLNFTEKVFFN